jgi:tetratricopeptide (TPR) repeat protein
MKGTLAEGVLPGLLRSLYVGRKSGHLHFTQGAARRTVLFQKGQIVRGESSVPDEHLGEIMVRHKLMSAADLARATGIVVRDRKRLGVVLRELGLVDDDRFDNALGIQVHEVLLKVFSEPTGEFAFEEVAADAPPEGETTLKVSTGELILEAVDRVRNPEVVRRSLGDVNRVLVLPSDPLLRFQKVTLTPTDGYILSRVDGVMSAREIIQMLGLPEEDVCRSLLGLLSTGLVEFRPGVTRPAGTAGTASPVAPAAKPAAPPIPAPAAASPAPSPAPPRPETTEDRRKEILDAWNGIKTRTHYEVLGVALDATAAQVKDAYFRLAKRLHPDVHTDPALADLHDKLEAIFIRLGQAYQALKDVKPKPAPPRPPAPLAPATASAPATPEAESVPAKMDVQKIHETLYKADKAFGAEKYWDAIQLAEGCISSAEGKHLSRARILLAKSFMKNPNWVRRAEEQLQLTLEKEPRNVEANYILANIYKAGGLKSRAISLLRRVIELKPDYEEAGAQLDALLASQDPEGPPPNEGFLKKFFGRS